MDDRAAIHDFWMDPAMPASAGSARAAEPASAKDWR